MPVTTQHPGNDYYVQPLTGTIQRQGNALLGGLLNSTGWLGPFTWAEAKANVKGLQAGIGAATPGGLPTVGPGGNIGKLTNPLSGVNAIGDFFNRLTQPNTWLRVGEVVAGLLLVYIGLNATMKDTAVGKAVNTAKNNAKRVAAVVPK